ncbi:hypothetical protein GO988_13240 [Hymenobacter sp. HMF4947]|uniref:Glycosyltransferase RgtA/B/C/D-like domain-containing protein n=1 Tax=Hymenobacter ginkgonis TaxID=2682976 RepID=A0A7K1TFW1_9BACT|nr:DUF6044 family protein [Hymenobacter ginkgonis]MVN77294.1 hypothetical protein [Hymenobacter ginkgonis]
MKPLRLALLGLLIFLVPVLLLGRHGYVLIHDNLDTEISLVYLLTKLHLAFAYGAEVVLPQVMNGIPRNALRPGLSVTVLLFSVVHDPLAAYLVHQVLVRGVGLLAMYWLLRRYGLARPEQRGLAAAVALAWATLPLYSIYGLTVLGQPALLRAALNLRRGPGRWHDWLVCAAFPLWSIFVYVGPFIAVVWGSLLAFDLVQGGRAAVGRTVRGAAGLALLLALYVVVEWPLFYSLLVAKQFVSHREEFDFVRLLPHGVGVGLKEALRFFWLGQYHASPFFRGVVLLAVALVLRQLAPARRQLLRRRVGLVLAGLAGVSLFCGFAPQLAMLYQKQLPLLHAFTLNRFHFLMSLTWFMVLVLALRELPATPGAWRLAYALVGLQFVVALPLNAEYVANLRILAGVPKANAPSYAAFTAPGLFGQVKAAIYQRTGQLPPAYRVASLGLPPAVAQLNDFYTLDSNQNSYPLPYKHAFRPLIAGELAKSPALATYFDAWGNRCYLMSAELGRNYLIGQQPPRTVQHFAFDAAAFRRLGGRYVLSAVQLAHPEESGLQLLSVFSDSQAYWQLHLYEAVAPK